MYGCSEVDKPSVHCTKWYDNVEFTLLATQLQMSNLDGENWAIKAHKLTNPILSLWASKFTSPVFFLPWRLCFCYLICWLAFRQQEEALLCFWACLLPTSCLLFKILPILFALTIFVASDRSTDGYRWLGTNHVRRWNLLFLKNLPYLWKKKLKVRLNSHKHFVPYWYAEGAVVLLQFEDGLTVSAWQLEFLWCASNIRLILSMLLVFLRLLFPAAYLCSVVGFSPSTCD